MFIFFFQAEDGIRDLTVTGVRRVLFRSRMAVRSLARDNDRTAILTRVEEAAAAGERLRGAVTFRLDQMERPDRQLLHERHLVSKELAGLHRGARARPGAGLVVGGLGGGLGT